MAEKDSVDNREFTKYTGVWEWFFYRQILRISSEAIYARYATRKRPHYCD